MRTNEGLKTRFGAVIRRCSSPHLGCNKGMVVLVVLSAWSCLAILLWLQISTRIYIAIHCNPIRSAVYEILTLACLAKVTMARSKSFISSFLLILMCLLNFSRSSLHVYMPAALCILALSCFCQYSLFSPYKVSFTVKNKYFNAECVLLLVNVRLLYVIKILWGSEEFL